MKSPFTGGKAVLEKDWADMSFRTDSFRVRYHYYRCVDSAEHFTTDDLDLLNISQVHNQYRAKYGIPFSDEIAATRNKYGLSAAKMSEVLGFGPNAYRQYENGDMPAISAGRYIRMAEDPLEFRKILELNKQCLEDHDYDRVQKKIQQAIEEVDPYHQHLEQYFFGTKLPTIYNGFKVPSVERIGRMVEYFARVVKPYTTAMNKLMFYADFGHFKKHGRSISGLGYNAIQFGPVPNNYNSIFDFLEKEGYIKIEVKQVSQDIIGEQFKPASNIGIEEDELFTATEIEMIKHVANQFRSKKANDLVEISHKELGWKNNVDLSGRINYFYGFELSQLD
jgi:transcriptional regulator with XRE-family HTH domain